MPRRRPRPRTDPPMSADVKDALGSVAPALQSYETAANTIVQQAFTDSSAAEKT